MKKPHVIFASLCVAASACSQQAEKQEETTRPDLPNFVFIYADDLGYGDLGCYGADSIATPNLDSLASEGVRFTDFYSVSPVSSPSRAGLLTGRYPIRNGMTEVFFPNSLQGIDSSEITLAEVLKEQGYATGIIGKWHLGHLPEFLPGQHGFDYYFGLPYSNDMEWEPRHDPPLPLMRNQKIIDQPAYQPTLTQRYAAEAINFMARHRGEPFFLYVPHTFPHKPLHVSAEFKGSSPNLYGDVVQELDKSVGDIVQALRDLGLEEKTLVVFSSDNGPAKARKPRPPHIGEGSTGGLRGHKATTFEGGVRVPTIAYWKGKILPGQVVSQPAIMLDWFPTFAKLAGAEVPKDRPLDGEDISPLLFGNAHEAKQDTFYFYWHDEMFAIRIGDWKYKKPYHGSEKRRKIAPHGELLFNLKNDPAESENLIEQNPEMAQKLKAEMKRFHESLGEIPPARDKFVPFDDPRDH